MMFSLLNQRNPYKSLCVGAENPEGNVEWALVRLSRRAREGIGREREFIDWAG